MMACKVLLYKHLVTGTAIQEWPDKLTGRKVENKSECYRDGQCRQGFAKDCQEQQCETKALKKQMYAKFIQKFIYTTINVCYMYLVYYCFACAKIHNIHIEYCIEVLYNIYIYRR